MSPEDKSLLLELTQSGLLGPLAQPIQAARIANYLRALVDIKISQGTKTAFRFPQMTETAPELQEYFPKVEHVEQSKEDEFGQQLLEWSRGISKS